MTKRLKGWDAYVADSRSKKERTLELPISDDEVYAIRYPTRKQGRMIDQARRDGDGDALLIALLGEQAGRRVIELADDQPHDVIDDLVIDVLRQFGFLPDDADADDAESESDERETVDVPLPNYPEPATASANSSTAST